MKTTTFVSLCLAGALLQGCIDSTGPLERDAVESDVEDTEVLREDGPGSAPASGVDAKIATLAVPGGQIVFVDEGLTEEGGGIAFWELGGADLSYLLDDRNATALEVFLALAPEGTPVPDRLLEHHAEVARRVAGISLEPRRIALPDLLAGVSYLTNDGLGDDGSASAKDCWGWGGPGAYDMHLGHQGFDYLGFQASFNSLYSQISGSNVSSGNQQILSSQTDFGGPTAAGHERAMAFCLSKAVSNTHHEDVVDACYMNQGRVNVHVERTTDAAYSNWVPADSILLTAFGHGGRFRSNYTNSGGGARKYRLFLAWQSLIAEGGDSDNGHCEDELFLAWRSKVSSGGLGGGPGGLIP